MRLNKKIIILFVSSTDSQTFLAFVALKQTDIITGFIERFPIYSDMLHITNQILMIITFHSKTIQYLTRKTEMFFLFSPVTPEVFCLSSNDCMAA